MTSLVTRLAAPAALALAAALAACGGSSSSKETYPTPPESTPAKVVATATPAGPKTVKGAQGDTLALDHIRVTMKGLKGPFKGFDVPTGRKLLGVELRIVNTGDERYDTTLPQGTLTMVDGEAGKLTNLISIGGKNPCDYPRVKLAKGQGRTMCLAFDVPADGRPQAFQYVADAGEGDTALWQVKR